MCCAGTRPPFFGGRQGSGPRCGAERRSWDPACTSLRRSWPRLGPCPSWDCSGVSSSAHAAAGLLTSFFFWIPFSSLWFSSLGLHPPSNQFSFLRPPEQVTRQGSLNGRACCPTACWPGARGGGRAGQLLLRPRGPSQPPSSRAPLHHPAWRCPLLPVSHRLPSLSKSPCS